MQSISEFLHYRTTEIGNFAQETVQVSGDRFTCRLPPGSITTYKAP